MMEIRFLFLTAVIASSGIPSAQPKFQMGTKAVANEVSTDNKVQQNLRSLFDSLSKNDMRRTDSLRDVLEREAEREQEAFDTMKEDLRLARGRHAYQQRTSHKNSDNGERLAVFKRETEGTTGTSEAPAAAAVENLDAATEEPTTDADESTQKILPHVPEKIDEYYNYQEPLDEFNHYKASHLYDWKEIEKAYEVGDFKFLSFFCARVHKLAGGGIVNVINNKFLMGEAVIAYQDPMYFPTDTWFLQYVIEQPEITFEPNHYYVTSGLKEDCIFYLIPTAPGNLTAFNMGKHVCGIDRALKSTMNTTSEIPACPAEPANG